MPGCFLGNWFYEHHSSRTAEVEQKQLLRCVLNSHWEVPRERRVEKRVERCEKREKEEWKFKLSFEKRRNLQSLAYNWMSFWLKDKIFELGIIRTAWWHTCSSQLWSSAVWGGRLWTTKQTARSALINCRAGLPSSSIKEARQKVLGERRLSSNLSNRLKSFFSMKSFHWNGSLRSLGSLSLKLWGSEKFLT